MRKQGTAVSAAMQVPSQAFAYRFWLSVCLLLLIVFSLTMRHSLVGVFIFAVMDAVFCADVFGRCAVKDAGNGKIRFSAFVITGVSAGLILSAYNTFCTRPLAAPVQEVYAYTALFITLSLWGQRRLVHMREKSRVFVKKLDDFLPKSGRKCDREKYHTVFAKELAAGEEVYVKAGERLPCDGVIVKGKTSLDEQLITGNFQPASKQPGDEVYAGTLNKSADITVRVVHPLEKSAVYGVIEAVKTGELRRSDFNSELDWFAVWILPILLAVGAGAYVAGISYHGASSWMAQSGALWMMLALGAPCTLVFCGACAKMFVVAGAKRKQLKIQDVFALQRLVQADTIFLDKTGTLTYGQLRVAKIYPAKGFTEEEVMHAAAVAENKVDGPFAQAVKMYMWAKQAPTPPKATTEFFPGKGVRARLGKDTLLVGSPAWLTEEKVKQVSADAEEALAVIGVAKNKKFMGYMTLADEVRVGAAETVKFLQDAGKEVVLMSGDNEASVAAVAKQVGISKINAGILPQTKAEIITNLRAMGKRVVMIGDGFNDIVALLKADAGIVYATGNNVYNYWVDVLVERLDLFALKDLFILNRRYRKTAMWNAVFAFAAALGWGGWLFWWKGPIAWPWTLGGAVVGEILIFINSMRLLR